jgi:hypothetical protein
MASFDRREVSGGSWTRRRSILAGGGSIALGLVLVQGSTPASAVQAVPSVAFSVTVNEAAPAFARGDDSGNCATYSAQRPKLWWLDCRQALAWT